MYDTLLAKGVSVIIIFFGSLICGLLPAFSVFSKFPRFALSLILSFGGGILIATSLVHILPEATHSWPTSVFTAEMTLCLGIFLVYVIEEVAHYLVCHDIHSPLSHGDEGGESRGHNHGVHVHHDNPPHRCDEPAAVFLLTDEKARTANYCHDSHHSHDCKNQNDQQDNGGRHEHNHDERPTQVHEGGGDNHHHNHNNHVKDDLLDDQAAVKLFPKSVNEVKILPEGSNRKSAKPNSLVVKLRSLVGLVALSVHAGLEGLSVGLGHDASDVWFLCGAVAAHKLVIAFCLGMEVRIASSKNECSNVQTSSSASFKFRYVLFFALMTPLGIALGTLVTEIVQEPNQKTESAVVAILQALAAGTLLYVAFFEVILRERARFSGKGLYQLLMVFIGWATMVVIEIIMKDYHNHFNHGHNGDEGSVAFDHEGHDHAHHDH